MVDAWLLRKFPGRTLEELDNVDYLRLMRALQADRVEQVEVKRRQLLEGVIDHDAINDDEWDIISRNDRELGIDTDG